MLNWIHKDSSEKLIEFESVLGKADMVLDQPNGFAIWIRQNDIYRRPSVFEKHMLLDKEIIHSCPVAHKDYLFSFMPALISPSELVKLNQLSGAVGYDKLKKLLYCRCENLEKNIIHLCMVMRLLHENLPISVASAKLDEKLKSLDLKKTASLAYAILYARTKKHYMDIAKSPEASAEFGSSYWAGAYNSDCSRPSYTEILWSVVPYTKKKKDLDSVAVEMGKVKALKLLDSITRKEHLIGSGAWYSINNPEAQVQHYREYPEHELHEPRGKYSQQLSESFTSEPWYAENNPQSQAQHYRSYPEHELYNPRGQYHANLHEMRNPKIEKFTYPQDPWYTSNISSDWHLNARNAQVYRPIKSSLNQDPDWDQNQNQDQIHRNSARFENNPFREGFSHKKFCICNTCKCREKMESRPVKDPRFDKSAVNIRYIVGSDVAEITTRYGTSDQKKNYPKYANYLAGLY